MGTISGGDLINVLDKGFVELQSVMGDDLAIVNAARTSVLGDSKGDMKDKKLLFYLMESIPPHTGPFEMVEFKFRVKCPIFVARQWMRSRTWSYSELSRRYTSKAIDFYMPDYWRAQSKVNRQASEGVVADSQTSNLTEFTALGIRFYDEAIQAGVAREQARMFLPVNMYTQFIAKVDAHNLMNFLRLRLSNDAQYEIRVYAEVLFDFLKEALPWTYESFKGIMK